jgi:hypothetical protein
MHMLFTPVTVHTVTVRLGYTLTIPSPIASFGNRSSVKPPNFSRTCNADTAYTRWQKTFPVLKLYRLEGSH